MDDHLGFAQTYFNNRNRSEASLSFLEKNINKY